MAPHTYFDGQAKSVLKPVSRVYVRAIGLELFIADGMVQDCSSWPIEREEHSLGTITIIPRTLRDGFRMREVADGVGPQLHQHRSNNPITGE